MHEICKLTSILKAEVVAKGVGGAFRSFLRACPFSQLTKLNPHDAKLYLDLHLTLYL